MAQSSAVEELPQHGLVNTDGFEQYGPCVLDYLAQGDISAAVNALLPPIPADAVMLSPSSSSGT
jgi:hypothetical protein